LERFRYQGKLEIKFVRRWRCAIDSCAVGVYVLPKQEIWIGRAMNEFILTEEFEQTAKELLSTGEKLVVLDAIEDEPWDGVNVVVESEEFGDKVKFIQFPLDGDKPSRRGHYIKVMYSIFDEGDRIILMHVGTETQWDRWMRNKATRQAIIAGLRALLMGA
jgi:hypothetical protein